MDYSDTTVIIPVKDEPAVGKVTRETISELKNCKVIVIHKGELGTRLPKSRNITVLRQSGAGKGRACVEAAKHVRTKIMCFIDGDDTYRAADLRKVVGLVREGNHLALGNRFGGLEAKSMPAYIVLGNGVLTAALNALYGVGIRDSQTGLRAIRRDVFNRVGIRETHFGIEEEMVVKVHKLGLRIAETPIAYRERVGVSKQFKPLDGVKLLLILFKFLIT